MTLPSRKSRRRSFSPGKGRRSRAGLLIQIILDLVTLSLAYTAYTSRDLPAGIILAGTYLLLAVLFNLHGIRASLPGGESPSRPVRAAASAVAIFSILAFIYGADSYFARWGNPWEPRMPSTPAEGEDSSEAPQQDRPSVPITSQDSPQFTGTVTAIVDPVTILLDDGLEVSLAHLKAPEPGTPAFRLALDLATNALLGQEVTVVPCRTEDAATASQWSPIKVSGVVIQGLANFNLRLLLEGGATFVPDSCQNMDLSQWPAYQEIAREARVGVWSEPSAQSEPSR